MYLYKEIYYEVLVYKIMEAGKSNINRVGWQARDPGEPMFQFKSESHLHRILFC